MQADKIPDEIMREAKSLVDRFYLVDHGQAEVDLFARALMARDKRAAEIANRYVNPPFLGCASTAHSIATAILSYNGGHDEQR